MLSGHNLTAKVGKKLLLDDVNFTVNPYEVVVIIGPNGAGKSSLFSSNAMQALGVSHLAQQCFTRLSGGEKQRAQLARVLCQLQPSLANKKTPIC